MTRFLALYVGRSGKPKAAIVTPASPGNMPFGVDEFSLDLSDYDGEPVTLVELPGDYVPTVVDVEENVAIQVEVVDRPYRQ